MENKRLAKRIKILMAGEIIGMVCLALSSLALIEALKWLSLFSFGLIATLVIELVITIQLRNVNKCYKSAFISLLCAVATFVVSLIFGAIGTNNLTWAIYLSEAFMLAYLVSSLLIAFFTIRGCRTVVDGNYHGEFARYTSKEYLALMIIHIVSNIASICFSGTQFTAAFYIFAIVLAVSSLAAGITYVIILYNTVKRLSEEDKE